MKKAILTIGLFSLVMILTSFTTPETKNTVKSDTNVNIIGQTSAGGNVKVDIIGQTSAGGNVKVDIIGQTSAGGNVKVD
ncbi:3-oxoacyl-ACP reductase [Flavobacterium sp. GB2R13]|uniref:3-oxoacyl-ACP reductase n=1 Tax=Flavobacterium algoris TaxID=3398733 RepID=UPI003A8AF61B